MQKVKKKYLNLEIQRQRDNNKREKKANRIDLVFRDNKIVSIVEVKVYHFKVAIFNGLNSKK